jgi:hypothetical protein
VSALASAAVLCCAVLCCAVLCCAVLCCASTDHHSLATQSIAAGQDKKANDFVEEVLRTEFIFPSLTHGSVYSLIASTARSLAETHNWEALAQYRFPLALASDLRNGGKSVGEWATMFKLYLRLLGLSNLPSVLDWPAADDSAALEVRADRLWSTRQEVTDSLEVMRNLSRSPGLERELKQDLSVLWRIAVDVQLGVAQAVHEWIEDRRDEAIAILTRMADIEDSYFKPSVKPSGKPVIRLFTRAACVAPCSQASLCHTSHSDLSRARALGGQAGVGGPAGRSPHCL